MTDAMKRPARGLVAFACVAAAAVLGALTIGEGSSPGQAPRQGDVVIEPVAFQADAGVARASILELGGLTLRASCDDYGRGQIYLGVTAQTAVDNAVAAVSFDQAKGPDSASYAFVQSDFDRSYGRWDILGTNPDDTAGTLNFSRPDGGQVVVSFVADEQTAQGDCVFGGTATYAPPHPDDPDSSFAVSDAYLGVSCPVPNSIACDRVALFVSTEDRPDYVQATIAGHRFRLDDAGWHPQGSTASFEGTLEVPGLLHAGPLAVAATADDRWFGTPPVEARVHLQGVYRKRATDEEEVVESVPLAAGYG